MCSADSSSGKLPAAMLILVSSAYIFRYSRQYGRTWRESSNFPAYGRKEGKLARCPAPHCEAWKLDSGAKVTGEIKMAEGSVRS